MVVITLGIVDIKLFELIFFSTNKLPFIETSLNTERREFIETSPPIYKRWLIDTSLNTDKREFMETSPPIYKRWLIETSLNTDNREFIDTSPLT